MLPNKPCPEASQVASMELRGVAARQQQLEAGFKLLVEVLVVVMLTMVTTEWPGGGTGEKATRSGCRLVKVST